ncbi:hypothetical protein BGL34_06220 [Fructilactobacillus lindneri]|uniref:N-(5'-phosphoribosyl)anthranilate isomerase n=2 Tax=Fructilactobacillus lindneri TaxID=53444 RepID=A0A0R2K2X8_9LACO|nr:phosphoribosylanthranilate isomerase [Fructilactobacillus lindneri]ANZ57476.1 hypothetical protein AYR60_01095 [Fructilactobacillus lindneri]ANZ58744.1 hypothetical protein AYR59_01095 [Fructilactobacillus lindneri]KRN80461.1 hypothetical protein IV52_GL000035 [Fructilactobacillus lindneri DSM 20690 = JCM 11027]POG97826.1 hypothetical protein BGL31_05685 [Fructilactobacillus lindneri]POG99159.1 hypothetical protein BGL32_05710 [Fructilactobacillus lindneri]
MTKIKICGLQTLADVKKCNAIEPDLVGFVFAKSPRQLNFRMAQALRNQLKSEIISVGVFVNTPIGKIQSLVQADIISQVQYYGKLTNEKINDLHQFDARVIQVVSNESEIKQAADAVMFDKSRGRGLIPDHFNVPQTTKSTYLSGGITTKNVVKAIQETHPDVVDVSSGSETNGEKDFTKMQRLTNLVHKFKEKNNEY